MNSAHNFMKTMEIGSSKSKAFCEVHGEYKPIIASHPCCEKCAENSIQADRILREKESFERFEAGRFKAAGVPDRYESSGFKNFESPQAGQKIAVDSAKKYSRDVRNGQISSMIFCGSTGTGKTHLAVGILKNVMARQGKTHPLFAKYWTSSDMAEHIATAYKRDGDSERAAMYRLTHEADLLIIDEYGLFDQDARLKKHVDHVLRARYDARKPTLLISNSTQEELNAMLGDRVWSRLVESDDKRVVTFNWADQRRVA